MLRTRSPIDFDEKKRARRRLYSPLTFLGLFVLTCFVGSGVWGMYQKSRHADEALAQTEAAYTTLKNREDFLNGEINRLSTDAGVEEEIRERYGVAKQGENVIVVLSDKAQTPPLPPPKTFWQKVKEWFSGNNDEYVKQE